MINAGESRVGLATDYYRARANNRRANNIVDKIGAESSAAAFATALGAPARRECRTAAYITASLSLSLSRVHTRSFRPACGCRQIENLRSLSPFAPSPSPSARLAHEIASRSAKDSQLARSLDARLILSPHDRPRALHGAFARICHFFFLFFSAVFLRLWSSIVALLGRLIASSSE